MGKKPRARTARRVEERAARGLVRDKQRLAALAPGGAPERPIEVVSSSVIAVRARSTRCPLCDGELRLDEETAETRFGRRLRCAHVTCVRCGVARELWFAIAPALSN